MFFVRSKRPRCCRKVSDEPSESVCDDPAEVLWRQEMIFWVDFCERGRILENTEKLRNLKSQASPASDAIFFPKKQIDRPPNRPQKWFLWISVSLRENWRQTSINDGFPNAGSRNLPDFRPNRPSIPRQISQRTDSTPNRRISDVRSRNSGFKTLAKSRDGLILLRFCASFCWAVAILAWNPKRFWFSRYRHWLLLLRITLLLHSFRECARSHSCPSRNPKTPTTPRTHHASLPHTPSRQLQKHRTAYFHHPPRN